MTAAAAPPAAGAGGPWSRLSARGRALAIGALALALRLVAVATIDRDVPPPPDFQTYDQFARLMLSGWHWFTTPLFVREPVYPAFMALAYALPGPDRAALLVLQALAGAGACALAYRALRRAGPEPVAAIAALLMAVSPHFVSHALVPIRETLVIVLFTAFLSAFLPALHAPGRGAAFASALWFVLLAHTDVRFLPLVAVLPVVAFVVRGPDRGVARMLAWAGLFFVLLMVPYQVRGFVAAGRPVVITERFLGLWLERTLKLAGPGGEAPVPSAPAPVADVREAWLREWEAARRADLPKLSRAEREYFESGGRPALRPLAVRWFLFREYWRFARHSPEYRPYPDGRFASAWSPRHNLTSTLVVVPYLVLLPFALFAGPTGTRRLAWGLAIFFAAHAALHVLVHARDRYRIPMEVLAAILTAIALVNLWALLRRRPVPGEPSMPGRLKSSSSRPPARG